MIRKENLVVNGLKPTPSTNCRNLFSKVRKGQHMACEYDTIKAALKDLEEAHNWDLSIAWSKGFDAAMKTIDPKFELDPSYRYKRNNPYLSFLGVSPKINK